MYKFSVFHSFFVFLNPHLKNEGFLILVKTELFYLIYKYKTIYKIMNIFKNNLKQSEMYEELLNNFYSKQVKGFKKIKAINFDSKWGKFQLYSCDKVILLNNGKRVLIEEKIRFKTYNIIDIFLEELSNSKTGKSGWIKKESKSKYLVYYIVPLNVIYIINFKKLQKVYAEKRQEWLSLYCWTYAKNEGYETKGICVPVEELELYLKIKKYELC